MSRLKPLGPLDFDYERFPGVALRATDKALKGHALIDRPEQVAKLAWRIFKLSVHLIRLAADPSLRRPAGTGADFDDELTALRAAASGLEDLLNFLPQEASSRRASSFEEKQLGIAAGGTFTALLDLLLLLLDGWNRPTGLVWYKELFDKGGVIPAPKALGDFLDPDPRRRNRAFASWWVQGNNPLCVTGVALREIEQALGVPALDPGNHYPRIVEGDTLADAGAQDRLFWVDFATLLDALEPGDYPVDKRLPKPRVLFAVAPACPDDEPFLPLAIFDDSIPALVWSDVADPANANAWMRAMLASLCANQLHHTFISHFPRTHFVMEAVAVATLRALKSDHPLFWLLRTHIDGTLGFNETALDSFTTQAGADRLLMASSLRTGHALMRRSLDGWRDFDFPSDLAQRRVTQLPYYPYRDDAQRWWDAIGSFVDDIVKSTYADDAAMTNDTQLQAWARVLVDGRTTQENGAELIPVVPSTRVELAELLRKILFTCTAYHAAVQIPLNAFDVSPLTTPCSLYPDDATDPPHAMLAGLGTSLFQLAFFYFGDVITHPVGTFTVENKKIPAKMRVPVGRFTEQLGRIETAVRAANQRRQKAGAYEVLLPENVSRSVDI